MQSFYKNILKPNASISVVYSSLDCSDIQFIDKMNDTPMYIAYCGLISSEEKDGLLLAIEGFSKKSEIIIMILFYIVGGNSNESYF